ncbi:hypothetical protein [Christiangramia sp.]|uniref:hypothetical protein n=1 Tax=Christiangramia sp. TaxID=1931228 RepID=UPI00262AF7D7|nr:hypothetical protein [Christiangramia sp.]
MKKENVLVTGIGQANYILQLYSEIGKKLPQYNLNVLNLRNFGNKDIENRATTVFNNIYFVKPTLKNFFTLLNALLPILTNRYFWKDVSIHIVEKGNIFSNEGLRLFLRHVNAYHYAFFIDNKTDTQLIHLHYPTHIFSLFTKYLKKEYKMIWTYWGSDIYRINRWRDHEIQNSQISKATIITAATPEMKFSILSRFGFQYNDKIRRARFIHDRTFYTLAEGLMCDRSWVHDFKTSFQLPQNKIIILMGHNGHPENNHLQFLQTIKFLPTSVLNKFHVVFPFTYGNNKPGYLEKLQNISKEIPLSFQFIENFLDWKDLAKLKIVSDVYIHCPTTDGLSAFLTEFLFTNNLAIVADWLPYKTFRDLNISYLDFKNFEELKGILMKLEEYLENKNEFTRRNTSIISKNFSAEVISEEWVSVLKEIY